MGEKIIKNCPTWSLHEANEVGIKLEFAENLQKNLLIFSTKNAILDQISNFSRLVCRLDHKETYQCKVSSALMFAYRSFWMTIHTYEYFCSFVHTLYNTSIGFGRIHLKGEFS